MFLHIDMDAFFASVEQAVNPHLKGHPLIVGSRANKYHTVVCAASYEAKALGIDSGMNTREAFQICPQAKFVAANSARYIFTSERIFELLQDFSPNLEYVSIDEFLVGLEGQENAKPLEVAKKIKQAIKKRFFITCSIGIAPTRILAKLASKINKPDGLKVIAPADIPGLFEGMPIEKLCGIGPSLKRQLNSLGIITLKDLFDTPEELLSSHFGKVGHWLYEAVRLNYDLPVTFFNTQNKPPKSISHSYTLARETSNNERIFAWIRLLSEMVSERLRRQNLEAKTVHLYLLNLDQNRGFSRQKTFGQATSDGYELYKRCRLILGPNKGINFKVRAIGVTASNFAPIEDLFLFNEQAKRYRLLQAQDSINSKIGEWSIFPAQIMQAGRK
ncbi:MAG: DNA polymerase IV [Candidatus Omnitrophica bacterium]|nr:DNA polymerase IV [Candidatus Omnitrophota bacterium]HOX54625.1 DNA polymerase IV [Candidatus Omnitrophota bacterium]